MGHSGEGAYVGCVGVVDVDDALECFGAGVRAAPEAGDDVEGLLVDGGECLHAVAAGERVSVSVWVMPFSIHWLVELPSERSS